MGKRATKAICKVDRFGNLKCRVPKSKNNFWINQMLGVKYEKGSQNGNKDRRSG